MSDSPALLSLAVFVVVAAGVFGLLALATFWFRGDVGLAVDRLRRLSTGGKGDTPAPAGHPVGNLFTKAGALLLPARERRARLQARLHQAGLYSPTTLQTFLGVKVLLATVLPVAAALILPLATSLPAPRILAAVFAAGCVGVVAPGLWLDHRKKKYQGEIRRALPDALDLLVLCVEGGGSLTAAVNRVTEDLVMAHPVFAAELTIVQREMQMGASAGEAFKRLGERCDLEDVRELASVLLQSERFGSGVAKALRAHADACRLDRQQRAEEMAQKAAVKILFPTLLCIFPAIFIVLLGPAAFQMANLLSKTR